MNNKYKYNYSKNYNYYNNYTLNNKNKNRHLSNIKSNNYSKKLLISNNTQVIIGSLLLPNYNKDRYREGDKEGLNKINNHHTINKKEDIYSKIRMISENKKINIKNQNIESLRVSTSGIYNSEGDKVCKNPSSINEPINLLQNRNLRNSNNIFSIKEEKKSYFQINSIQNGSCINLLKIIYFFIINM